MMRFTIIWRVLVFHKFLAWAGIAVLVVGLVVLVLPVSRIPLLDANRQVLAESEREGYCAGQTFGETRGIGDTAAAKECRQYNARPTEPNLAVTQKAFCQGLMAGGYPITLSMCQDIMVLNRFWPTMDGSITNSWNRRFPYPGDMIAVAKADPEGRTGDRDNIGREGIPYR